MGVFRIYTKKAIESGAWGQKPPVESRSKARGRGSDDEVPQKLERFCAYSVGALNFDVLEEKEVQSIQLLLLYTGSVH